MIKSFSDKETEHLYITNKSKKFPTSVCKTGIRKLDYLNGAVKLEDLRMPPGNHMEALSGKYKVSIASGSTTNIGLSLNSWIKMPTMWKLLTIIKWRNNV